MFYIEHVNVCKGKRIERVDKIKENERHNITNVRENNCRVNNENKSELFT